MEQDKQNSSSDQSALPSPMQLDTFVDERMKILYPLSLCAEEYHRSGPKNETNVILSYTSMLQL